MKTLPFILLALATSLLARPTLEEALQNDPANALVQEILPTPSDLPTDAGDRYIAEFGFSLAIHGDLAVVGAPVNRDWGAGNPGAVYLFRRSATGWAQIQKLNPPDAAERYRFGCSVDLSEDASFLVVGSDDRDQSNDATGVVSGAYLYRRNPSTGRFELLEKLVPSTAQRSDRAGTTVGISGDWVAVAAPNDRSLVDRGSVTLFKRDSGSGRWLERQVLTYDESLFGSGTFGDDLAIDANTLVVANQGVSAYTTIYHRDAATDRWVLETPLLLDDDVDDAVIDIDGRRLIERNYNSSNVSLRERVASAPDGVPVPEEGTWPRVGTTVANLRMPFGRRAVGALSGNLVFLNAYDEVGAASFQIVRDDGTSRESYPVFATENGDTAFTLEADARTLLVAEYLNSQDGHQVSAFVADEPALVQNARRLLFYEDAAPADKNDAAFAYQVRLYDDSLGDFITRHDEIDSYYAQVNRDNAAAAESILRSTYPNAGPATADEIEQLFLDLSYGRAAAQLIISKNTMRTLNRQRLDGTPLTPGKDLFLDDEIDIMQSALDQVALGLDAYLTLLEDSLGVPPVEGNPAGRALFAKHVPHRTLVSAIDTDADPDSDPDVLLPSHKDLVLLYELFLQHARATSDLAFLRTARGTPADEAAIRALIGDTQRLVFEQRVLLDSLFDPAELTPALRDSLGLSQLSASIAAALNDLAAFEQNLDGTINLLGYEPDFLMLIQNQGGLFNSFDSFKAILEETNSPLEVAKTNRTAALDTIDSYESKQDSLEAEFSRLATVGTSALIPRLTEIVGVPYGEAGYDTPQDNVGSEIWQQLQSIEVARLRIERNSAEISNLHEKVRIEQERRRRESAINSEIGDLIIEYGDQQASMTEEIGRIEAAQAAANSLASAFTAESLFEGIVNVVNGAVQAGGEVGKANLEASKERLAATQDAAIRDKEDEILGENSKALIKNLLLEMNTLVIDSQEAALLLRQEAGRLTALYCEKADLERRLLEADSQLAARYFADPIHRLRALNTTERAQISFRNARQWLFFAARALEYKWNTPVELPGNFSSDGRAWTLDDLFKLRNAAELDRFFIALCDWDTLIGNNRTFVLFDDWISLREDYFGYELNDDLTGDPLFYDVINPATGEIENVDAVTAFRFELQRLVENCDADPLDEVCLRFDTVRRNDFDTVTGQYQADFFSEANYLDRIDDLQIFIRGPHQNLGSFDSENTVGVELSYLGTSFIRNETPGMVSDAGRPDLVSGEYTAYPNRFYRFSAGGYQFTEGLTFNSAEALKVLPDRSRATLEASVEPAPIDAFRERSVATTGWLLTLQLNPGVNPGSRLVIDEIDDLELYINHRAVQR